mgnify:CR=1 FL=1
MTPEDQNAVDIQQKTENYLQRKLWAFKQWKEKADTQYANQQSANMENDTKNLYEKFLQATDKEIKDQYNVASRWNLLAEMISNVGREKGYDITGNASDIIWTYLQWFPNDSQAFYEFTHGDQDPEDFAVQMGWMEKPENDAGFFTNVVWWAYDSATWIPRMLAKWAANAIGWVAKQFWADDEKVNALVNDYKNYLDSDWSAKAIGADTDSLTYKWSKLVSDLTQTAAYGWLAKNAVKTALWGYPLVTKATPLWVKATVWAIEWAWDMAIYDMVSESELPSGKDLLVWGALWAVSPILWAVWKATGKALKTWAKSTAAKLELSWMLNPAKLTEVKNRLIDEWVDIAWAWLKKGSAEDVGTWMIERWMQWDKPTIINKLWEHATKARQMKLDTLWKSTTLNEIPSANESLKLIYDTISDVPWLEKTTQRVSELMWKDKFTWKEADEIKTILDDTFSIFTNAWDVKAWAIKKWLANVRRDLKVAIEEWAKKEWLWDIKMLNNEIQIARWLKDWISKKDSADVAREMLSVFSKPALWAVFWASSPVGVFDNSTWWGRAGNAILWALAGKYLFSTNAKTTLAAKLNKLSWGSKKELERLIAWESIELSSKTQKELLDILQDVEALPISTMEAIPNEEAEAMAKYVQLSLFD